MFEQSSRPFKITVLALFIVALLMLVYFMLMQRGLLGKFQPAATSGTKVSPTGTQAGQTSIPVEDAQKQFQTIQEQANAGTLTQEEARKQMQAVASKMAPPPLPPEIKKQMEEARKAQ